MGLLAGSTPAASSATATSAAASTTSTSATASATSALVVVLLAVMEHTHKKKLDYKKTAFELRDHVRLALLGHLLVVLLVLGALENRERELLALDLGTLLSHGGNDLGSLGLLEAELALGIALVEIDKGDAAKRLKERLTHKMVKRPRTSTR